MSIHKLTAGSGYDYLTRQVAAMDSTEKGRSGLASYYTEKGETPGVWMGSGMAGIDGLDVGDIVTADHMQNLFGRGFHPLATERTKELDLRVGRPGVASPTEAERREATRLGSPFKVYENDVSAFRVEVAKRFAALNEAAGLPGDWPVEAAERARIRTEVGREFFRAEHGRDPHSARELAATIAKHSRPKTTAVAGFDLTFTPVKSVSTLWAVADQKTSATIERGHQAAMKDALDFIEAKALFTRLGTNGVRQVNVRGLVATAFTHRDSRAGEPLLHTHVAVANKVQTEDGKWRAIDGRVLFKATVAASEVYNTSLERHLGDSLGLRFEERPNEDARKRPVREVVGVDPGLNARWSTRRKSIDQRRDELAVEFQRTHGRPPTPIESIQLSQQATLETREAKHEPRTLAEQRAAWHRDAVEVLGSGQRVKQMIHGALNPTGAKATLANSKWFKKTANNVVATMEDARATWQYWHVYAEAQRQVRAAKVPTRQVPTVVDLLVSEVLENRSVGLARPADDRELPSELLRANGDSVYTVAGADLYTSTTVLEAERRLVAAAGVHDGKSVEASLVDMALLESAANGLTLNAGQRTLVTEMATSGARLQLAIAPAGSGKTTAMEVLSRAWTASGGNVMGAATAAGAAKVLGEKIQATSDSLAMLVTAIENGLEQADAIGPETLLIIDEAGMADTKSLDTVVGFVLSKGGSVRLIGDDQQLSAIGAGGVLRDIQVSHGALQLTELVRFKDPAEGAVSLALREGKPEALGFYLDRDRIQVGDLGTMTEEVFGAWQADRAKGLDAMMLAPSRELVTELNQRAQASRLDGADPATIGPWIPLADGTSATVGDIVVTRDNDRRLRVSATDWVKNGDRWTVIGADKKNATLTVKNLQHGRIVKLPAKYVKAHTELGYASTVHRAQGLTADTTHGLATGQESRQLLYTLLSRGAISNHLYLEVASDGDPHAVLQPNVVHPLTPTDILESVLARDEAQRSATTLMRDLADPRTQLGEATAQYVDSLYLAAEHFVGTDVVSALDTGADNVVPGLTDQPAWPTLRAHLLLIGAQGSDPLVELEAAASSRELDSAADTAAVLDWRLDSSGHRNAGTGPLSWLPGIPKALAEDDHWGNHLTRSSALVKDLAGQVQTHTAAGYDGGLLPAWAHNGSRPTQSAVVDVEVWRAAMQVPAEDRRPTGAPQWQKAALTHQRKLNKKVAGQNTPALKEWSHLLHQVAPQVRDDAFTPLLAERLAAMSRAGVPARQLLHSALEGRELPDEHAAAALWWRMARHLTPAVAEQLDSPNDHDLVTAAWTTQLIDVIGAERAERIQASAWWPALVTNIDHGLQRGWKIEDLLSAGAAMPSDDVDECQALVWRTSIALDPIPGEEAPIYDYDEPPADMWEGVDLPDDVAFIDLVEHADLPAPEVPADLEDRLGYASERPADSPPAASEIHNSSADPAAVEAAEYDMAVTPEPVDDDYLDSDLAVAGHIRDLTGITELEPTDADIRRMFDRAAEWDQCPVPEARLLEVNSMTQRFFEAQFTDSWGRGYLTERFGIDLAGDAHFQPGQAPAGWNGLVQHLHRQGVSDEEMIAAGVAKRASTGRMIDTFRDRVMFPVTKPGTGGKVIVGFVGRRHPSITGNDPKNPKYLNTASTVLFHKGAQLFGAVDELLDAGGIPVIVEGPMDAVATTIASAGRYVGVAPLGVALTEEQTEQLARVGRDPIVATDGDLAGQVAAERDFWMLTPHGMDPGYAQFPAGRDPSDVFTLNGPAALTSVVDRHRPLGEQLVNERLDNLSPADAAKAAARIIAARPGRTWTGALGRVRTRLQVSQQQAQRALLTAVRAWDGDPREAARGELNSVSDVKTRMEAAAAKPPAERWAGLAGEVDGRLVGQRDWPITAKMLQEAHDQGHDVRAAVRAMVEEAPLSDQPARDLRYRLVSRLDITVETGEANPSPTPTGAVNDRKKSPQSVDPRPGTPRR